MGIIMLNGTGYGIDETVVDRLEATVDGNTKMIADEYVTTKTYNVGDRAIHNNKLYQCTGTTSGTWASNKWKEVKASSTAWGDITGTLSNQTDLNTALGNLQDQIDTFTALTPGSTTGDAELTNIRVGYNNTTYSTAGVAVRTQVSDLHTITDAHEAALTGLKTGFDGIVYSSPVAMVQGSDEAVLNRIITRQTISQSMTSSLILKPNGTVGSSSAAFSASDFVEIPKGVVSVSVTGEIVSNPYCSLLAFYTRAANETAAVISSYVPDGNQIIVKVPDGAKYVRIGSNTNISGVSKTCYYEFNIISEVAELLDDVTEVQEKTESFYFSDVTPDFTENPDKYLFPSTGQIKSLAGFTFGITDAKAIPENAISLSCKGIVTNNLSILIVAFYSALPADGSATFISGICPEGSEFTVTIPNGAKYVRFGSNTNSSGVTANVLSYNYTCNSYVTVINQKIAEASGASVTLRSASTYDMIVGDTLELFYKGMIDSVKDENYYVMASCPIGGNFRKKFIVTPSAAGTSTLGLSLYDGSGKLTDTKSISLIARATPTSPGTAKNILCVGDSLTVGGQWPKEFSRRMTGSGGTPTGFNLSNVNFIGSCVKDGVHFEGYGGWTFGSYNSSMVSANYKLITCAGHDKTIGDQHSIYKDGANNQWKLETIESGQINIILTSGNASTFPSTGTLTWVSGGEHHEAITYTASVNAPGNPFWDIDEEKVDFTSYCERIGASGIDYIYVLLGWNAATNTMATNKQQAQLFINNVKLSYPNAKIVLMGLQIPARDGLGYNYGATGTWSNYKNLVKYVHDLDDLYAELVEENTNVYQLNISAQFDTENNMQTGTRPVNTRNATTETFQNNGVHPAESGYLQIADAATRHIVGIL